MKTINDVLEELDKGNFGVVESGGDMSEVKSFISSSFSHLKEEWKRELCERLEGENLENNKSETNNDWFYGHGFNQGIKKAIELTKES